MSKQPEKKKNAFDELLELTDANIDKERLTVRLLPCRPLALLRKLRGLFGTKSTWSNIWTTCNYPKVSGKM